MGIPLEWAGYTGTKNNAALEERAGRSEQGGASEQTLNPCGHSVTRRCDSPAAAAAAVDRQRGQISAAQLPALSLSLACSLSLSLCLQTEAANFVEIIKNKEKSECV